MSLRLWLPLNGTLENKGSDTVTIINNNATIDSSGKIGQCYSFNNSDSMIKIEGDLVSSMKSKTSFTISFWLYSNDSGNRSIYFATNTGTANVFGFALEKTTGELLRFYWQGSPDLNLSTFTIPNQEWVHIACVYKNDNVYLYKNGVLTASKTDGSIKISALTNTWSYASLGRDYRTGSTTLNGKLNDFRWYDNALSEKEIKEIAKGLVLHLPLNNNGLGNKNILFNSKESFNVIPAANVNVTARSLIEDNTCPIGGKVASFTIGANGTTSSGCYYNMTQMGINPASSYLTSNATYTLSFYGKSSVTAYLWAAALVESQTLIKYTPTSDKGAYIKLTSNWQKYTVTFQWTSTSKMTVCFYAYPNTSEVTFNIAGLKLEEGSVATPWCPNVADVNNAGLDGTIEYDCSGYCNNGTKTGSFSWTSDTPRYNVSTKFNGSQRIEAPFNPGNSPTFTVAGWFYHTGGTTYYGAKNNYNTFICLEGSRYFVYNGAGSAYVGNWTSITNTWQHVVLVHDAITSKLKLYINGSFVSEVTTNGTIYGSDILDIGGRQGAAQYSGKMSDFRIYATALSAEDIKSLYNNNAYIDSNGKIYGEIR